MSRGVDDAGRWTRGELLADAGRVGVAAVLGGWARGLAWPADALGAAAARVGTDAGGERFVSRPDLRPPPVTVVQASSGTAPGFLFLTPSAGPGQRGPLIVDEQGALVWFRAMTPPNVATDLRVAEYAGAPVLTWWEGNPRKGLGTGEFVVVDGSYRVLFRLHAGRHRPGDLHEFLLTPRGTALVTSYETVMRDLRSLGGPRRWPVAGGVVQELELPSGRVLFEWRSLEHVGLDESHIRVGPVFDYFHLNSIDVDADGDLIISARNTWAVYKVSRRSGKVLWRLGGKRSDFGMGRGTRFAWQHDARLHDGGSALSLFDDEAAPQIGKESRGIVLALDGKRMRATLVHEYVHRPEPLLTRFMGNMQMLDNGNVLVGWGSAPYITEFDAGGAVVFDAKLPRGGQSYRAFRFPWAGAPSEAPRLAVGPDRALYASWNGATDVAMWQLLVGGDGSGLQPQASMPRQGFETRLERPPNATAAVVAALDKAGQPLGQSAILPLG